jgi:hypothetical protein
MRVTGRVSEFLRLRSDVMGGGGFRSTWDVTLCRWVVVPDISKARVDLVFKASAFTFATESDKRYLSDRMRTLYKNTL